MTIEIEDKSAAVQEARELSRKIAEVVETFPHDKSLGLVGDSKTIPAEALTALVMATNDLLDKHGVEFDLYVNQLADYREKMFDNLSKLPSLDPHPIFVGCLVTPTSHAFKDVGHDYISLSLYRAGFAQHLGCVVVRARTFAKAVERIKELGIVERVTQEQGASPFVGGFTLPATIPPPENLLDRLMPLSEARGYHAKWASENEAAQAH